MKKFLQPSLLILALMISAALACQSVIPTAGTEDTPIEWQQVRSEAQIVNHMPDEFANPHILPLANDGWEDGIYITRDGLDLYCIYTPADALSFVLAGGDEYESGKYMRGPELEMDTKTNPIGAENWIHGDIYHASRTSLEEAFTIWQPVGVSTPIWGQGAPQGVLGADGNFAYFIYTNGRETEPYDINLWLEKNVGRELEKKGVILSDVLNTEAAEDNPHLEILEDGTLILFFERPDDPENISVTDIWYSTSTDDGTTWETPTNLTAINTFGSPDYEHIQPHLYYDTKIENWYLYFVTGYEDSKLAIFRAEKGQTWMDWHTPEVVLSAGNTIGVGEPSLTDWGDLYFVVIYEHPDGTETNRFDADPWMVEGKSLD